jgi:heat shock protein HslJ
MRNLPFLTALALLLATACASETPQPSGRDTETPEASPAGQEPSFRVSPPEGAWRLIAFGDATEVADKEVTLDIGPEGGIGGTGGCNRYFGQWSDGDGRATVGPLGATKMMCPPEVMAVEDRYLQELERTAGWRSHVDGIVLVDGEGEPLLVFDPVVTPEE